MADAAHPKAIENEGNPGQFDVDFGDAVISVASDQATTKAEAIAVAKKVYENAPKAVNPTENTENE